MNYEQAIAVLNMNDRSFLDEHVRLSRRFFLQSGVLGFAATGLAIAAEDEAKKLAAPAKHSKPDMAGALGEPYFTPQADFGDVSRGKPLPSALPNAKKREVGLTRETWRLEVVSDPEHPATLGKELTKQDGTAFDFAALLEMGKTHAVRFAKIMTCLNVGCPLGTGLWEGVPLREVVWLTQPRAHLRRVFYYGYHNDDPHQIFRSSLPIGRVLEDYFDLPPVILCYKLNGEWLDSERGGPVRIVVPEAYGYKSIKWLTHVVLTNLPHANDTYADSDNDVDSPLKTFAASLSVPRDVKAGDPIPVSGYAQVGISGLSKVQVSIESVAKSAAKSAAQSPPENGPYFTTAHWTDAELLAPPKKWDSLPEGKIPAQTHGFDSSGKPTHWPLRLAKAHWAALLPVLPPGTYTFRCRTIDEKGQAQPLPRPFAKSGRAAIESITVTVN